MDIEPWPHVNFRTSIDNLSMIADSSVTEIYSSHALEYLTRKEARLALQEWFRVMTPGGALFVSVPDFDSLISIYTEYSNLSQILGPLFGIWENLKLAQTIQHKTIYNEQDLSQALMQTGFVDILKFNPIQYLEQIDPKYDDYSLAFVPHMDRDGIPVSLSMSARKPE